MLKHATRHRAGPAAWLACQELLPLSRRACIEQLVFLICLTGLAVIHPTLSGHVTPPELFCSHVAQAEHGLGLRLLDEEWLTRGASTAFFFPSALQFSRLTCGFLHSSYVVLPKVCTSLGTDQGLLVIFSVRVAEPACLLNSSGGLGGRQRHMPYG